MIEVSDEGAMGRYVRELRGFVYGDRSIVDFFPAFMRVVGQLAGPDGLSAPRLAVFQALEVWESSTGAAKVAAGGAVVGCAG